MSTGQGPIPPHQRDEMLRRTLERAGELRARQQRRHQMLRTVPAVALVLVLTAGVATVIVTATSSNGHRPKTSATNPSSVTSTTSPASTTTTPPSTTMQKAVLPLNLKGFDPISFTAVSLDRWWVLGSVSCSRGRCPVMLATSNGGASFTRVAAPSGISVSFGTTSGVRFVTASDGWAFGPGLWSTTDGGDSWKAHATPGTTTDVEAGDGRVFGLACSHDSCSLFSPNSSGFAVLKTGLKAGASLSVSGPTVVVSNGPASSTGDKPVTFLVSSSGGKGFTFRGSPCYPGLGGRAFVAISGGGDLWAACPTGMMAQAKRSENDGRTWSAITGAVEFSNGLGIAPVSAKTALVWPYANSDALGLTTNGGASFRTSLKAPSGGVVLWAGFSDPSRAYCLIATSSSSYSNELWESSNSARSWHRVTFG